MSASLGVDEIFKKHNKQDIINALLPFVDWQCKIAMLLGSLANQDNIDLHILSINAKDKQGYPTKQYSAT